VAWSPRAVGSLLYLVVFGSIVAYSSYLIALERLPVAVVSIYTYVNPIVAVTLGWIFYREPLGWREFTAMAIIFFGLALVKRFSHTEAPKSLRPATVEK
jgi:drug/metabolite transporter (DMT)-like permease